MDAAPGSGAGPGAGAGSEPPGAAGIVLYDGVCGLCDRTVQWLLDADVDRRLRFAALQGRTAAEVRARHPEIPAGADTILYVDRGGGDERVLWRSRAVFAILRALDGRWRWLAPLAALPAGLTDLAYRLVARVRYRLFGRLDACRLPRPEDRARFLP